MKLLAYRGKSWISKIIKFFTRSEYSHIAIELDDGSVIEAWTDGGVRHVPSFRTLHKEGTQVDVFDIECYFNEEETIKFLRKQVGKKYDWKSVLRFLTKKKAPKNDAWFCSELAEYGIIYGGERLLNGNPSQHSPAHTLMSPFLKFKETRFC